MAQRPSHRPAAHGSRTTTVEHTPEVEAGPSRGPSESTPVLGVLKLRGAPLKKQRVVWSEETVDNEGMGKKKSKICCIYHKPRAFDESSSESDSSDGEPETKHGSDRPHVKAGSSTKKRDGGSGGAELEDSSESDGGQGDGRARPTRKARRKKHSHGDGCRHSPQANKYDIQPKNKE